MLQEKGPTEQLHDKHLRKFEHSKALDAVMKPYVRRRFPEYSYSVFKELIRRKKLKVALAGRNEKSLSPILTYLCNNISDSRFSGTLIQVTDALLGKFCFSCN